MFRRPNRALVTMQALRGRPPLSPLVIIRSNDLDGRANPATFRSQALSMTGIEPDRPRVAPSIDIRAYAPKTACRRCEVVKITDWIADG
jgi:hypothetical protein